MSLATRALFTGAIPDALPRGAVAAITTAPDGGWTQIIEPRAIEHDGIVYFCLIDGDDGHIKVGSWDGTTTTLTTVGTAPEVDTHDAPVIEIRLSDERLMVFWSGHLGAAMNMRVSTNPLDVSSWATLIDLDSQLGGDRYTYPSIMQLDNGDLHLFFRDHPTGADYGKWCRSISTDDGATWSALAVILQDTDRDPYPVFATDGTRIDIATSDAHPLSEPDAAIHHLYWDGAWKAANGSSLGSPPFTASDLPLVGSGPGWPHGVVTDGPVIAYTIDDVTTTYYVATWTGSTWVLSDLEDAGVLVSGEDPSDMALIDADTAYAGVKVGSFYELHRYKRAGGWTPRHVTEGSSVDNIYPARIHGGTLRRVAWLRGTYTSYLDNSLAVWAGR